MFLIITEIYLFLFRTHVILRDFQRILHDSDSQNETVHEHAIQIMEWLKKLIEETKKELKKYENPHS